jgi:hypothetical protein
MGFEEIAKCAYVLFHSQIGNVAAIARKSFRLRHSSSSTFFVRIAKKEFPWFDRWARAGCRLHSRALDDWLRQPIPVTKVLVSVIKRGDGFQIHGGQQFDSVTMRQIPFVLLATALTFGDVAGKQYDNRMKVGTCEPSDPMIRVVGACGAEDARSGSHPLTKLLGEGG